VNLERAVRLYVERKQSLGFHFEAAIHRSLLRALGDVPLRSITPRQIEAFLNGPRTGNSGWHQKYETVERFFRFWVLRGKLKRVPMPPYDSETTDHVRFIHLFSGGTATSSRCRTRQKTALSVRHRPRNVVGLLALSLRNRQFDRRGRVPCMQRHQFLRGHHPSPQLVPFSNKSNSNRSRGSQIACRLSSFTGTTEAWLSKCFRERQWRSSEPTYPGWTFPETSDGCQRFTAPG
jgi:hypothetical protein